MSELDTQKLIDMNYRALTLLGFATALICEYRQFLQESAQHSAIEALEKMQSCNSFLTNMENVVYFDKPMAFSKGNKK